MKPSTVAATGVDGEGGVFTDGVRVVVVMALPGVVVIVEDEVAGQEEDLRANFAALAHPLTVQPDGQVGPRRQDGRVELVRAVDDTTGDAAVVVVLKKKKKIKLITDFILPIVSLDKKKSHSTKALKIEIFHMTKVIFTENIQTRTINLSQSSFSHNCSFGFPQLNEHNRVI